MLDTPYAAYLGAAQLFELQGEIDALHHPGEFGSVYAGGEG